jgi:hypothetical protein
MTFLWAAYSFALLVKLLPSPIVSLGPFYEQFIRVFHEYSIVSYRVSLSSSLEVSCEQLLGALLQ